MNASLNFAVLGSGNGGRAFCGQIAHRGYPVVMYEPLEETEDYLKLSNEKNPATFRHYIDGVTPLISEQMMKMDEERMAIGHALGLELTSTMDQLMTYYGRNESQTYYEYVNSDQSPYKDIVGHNVRSRYITEDVPCLHVPAIELAHLAGMAAPRVETCVKLSSLLHGVDYAVEGTTLEKLGYGGKTVAEIGEMG